VGALLVWLLPLVFPSVRSLGHCLSRIAHSSETLNVALLEMTVQGTKQQIDDLWLNDPACLTTGSQGSAFTLHQMSGLIMGSFAVLVVMGAFAKHALVKAGAWEHIDPMPKGDEAPTEEEMLKKLLRMVEDLATTDRGQQPSAGMVRYPAAQDEHAVRGMVPLDMTP